MRLRRPKKSAPLITPEQRAYFKTPEGHAELTAYFSTPEGAAELRRALVEEIRDKQPRFREAVWFDARIFSSLLMQPPTFDTRLGFIKEAIRLAWSSDAFLALLLYRVRVSLLVREVPLLPSVLHRLSMIIAQVCIGDGVVMKPGVYLPHGQVVIDGRVEIGEGTVLSPWVTLGRNGAALEGPTIGAGVFVGTGAKILGPIQVGESARVGANAVVLSDVEANTTVVGAPARQVQRSKG